MIQEGACLQDLTKDLWEDLLVDLRETTNKVYQNSEESKLQARKTYEEATHIHKVVRKTDIKVTEIDRTARDNSLSLDTLKQTTTKTSRKVDVMEEEMRLMMDQGNKWSLKVEELHLLALENSAKMLKVANEKATEEGIKAQNAMMGFLWDAYQVGKGQSYSTLLSLGNTDRATASVREPQAWVQKSNSMLSQEGLMKGLGVPLAHPAEDFENVLRISHEFDPTSLGQANSFLRSHQFRKWSKLTRPEFLLVDGGLEPPGPERLSAMSFVCASLIAGLIRLQGNIVCLHFFCGLYTFSSGDLTGPSGLIRSLVCQIAMEHIRRKTLSLNFIDSRSFKDAIERHDLAALCETFRLLVGQLPLDTPVYCIVDGISWYEAPETLYELKLVVDKLRELVADDRLCPVLKVLMTSANRSRYIGKQVSGAEYVSLRPDFAMDDVLTERMVMAETRDLHAIGYDESTAQQQSQFSGDDDRPEDFM